MTRRYNLFISYSRKADERLAPRIQRALHQVSKPWYRRRTLRVFRDTASLSASPALWPEIERALEQSDFFLLLASPEAARSTWVRRELEWWKSNRGAESIIIGLSAGQLVWNETERDFDWNSTDSLPPTIRGWIHTEPGWVDFRWAKDVSTVSMRNAAFRDAILSIAARALRKNKDDLDGDDIRHHRRNLRFAWAAVALIGVGLIASLWQAFEATRERRKAEEELVRNLVEIARASLNQGDVQEAGETLARASSIRALDPLLRLVEKEAALRTAQQADIQDVPHAVGCVHFSPDSKRLVLTTYSVTGAIEESSLWDIESTSVPDGVTLQGHVGNACAEFSASASLRGRIFDRTSAYVLTVRPEDNLVFLSSVQAPDLPVAKLRPPTGKALGAVYANNRDDIAVLTDRAVLVYDSEKARFSRQLPPAVSWVGSEQGAYAAYAATEGQVYLLDTDAWQLSALSDAPLARAERIDESEPDHLYIRAAFRSDEKQVLIGGVSGAKLYDTKTGALLRTITASPVSHVAFSPYGNRFVVVESGVGRLYEYWNDADCEAGICLYESGQLNMAVPENIERAHPPLIPQYSPDGTRIVSPSYSGRATAYASTTGEKLFDIGEPLAPYGTHLARLSPDGRKLATIGIRHFGSGTRDVAVFRVPPSRLLARFSGNTSMFMADDFVAFAGHNKSRVYSLRERRVVYVSDGNHLACCLPGPELLLAKEKGVYRLQLNRSGGDIREALLQSTGDLDVQSLAVDETTGHIAVAGRDSILWFRAGSDTVFRKEIDTFLNGIESLKWSKSKEHILIRPSGLLDLKTGGVHSFTGGMWPGDVRLSRDRRSLIVVSVSYSLGTATNNRSIENVGFDRSVIRQVDGEGTEGFNLGSQLDESGLLIDHFSYTGELRVIDAEDNRLVFSVRSHPDRVTAVAFDPRGLVAVTGSEDAVLRVWDVKSRRLLFSLEGHQGVITNVKFSRSGEYLLSESSQDEIFLWDLGSDASGTARGRAP